MMLDRGIPPDGQAPRSATEVIERMKEMADDMGAAFSRIQAEMIEPIIQRTLSQMEISGLLDFQGLRVDGKQIKINPISPLAMAQQQQDVQSLMGFAQIAAQFGPAGQMAVNPDKAIDYVGDRMGIPSQVRFRESERAELMQQVAQQMQQAAPAMAQGAEAAPQQPPQGGQPVG